MSEAPSLKGVRDGALWLLELNEPLIVRLRPLRSVGASDCPADKRTFIRPRRKVPSPYHRG